MIVDLSTHFYIINAINNKLASTIIKVCFFSYWISAPKNFFDKSCEFNNSKMWEMVEAFIMKLMTTTAENTKSNAINSNLANKNISDTQCDL